MESLHGQQNIDNLTARLNRKIHIVKKDDFESIKAKIHNALMSDSRGRNLLKPTIWNDTILQEVIPRMVFKKETGKDIKFYKPKKKDHELTDFVKDK